VGADYNTHARVPPRLQIVKEQTSAQGASTLYTTTFWHFLQIKVQNFNDLYFDQSKMG